MSAASKNNFVIRMKVRDDKGNVVGETEAITFNGLLHRAFRVAVNVVAVAVEELAEEAVATTSVTTTPIDDNNGNVVPPGPNPALVRARGRDPEPETAATTDRRSTLGDPALRPRTRGAHEAGGADLQQPPCSRRVNGV
jgi:hypothetical protein